MHVVVGDRNRASFGQHQTLVYLHMPKTGGRTSSTLLPRVATGLMSPFNQWSDYVQNRDRLGDYRVLHGHLFARILDFLDSDAVSAAFFRDPITRAVSEYQFIRRMPDHLRYEQIREQSFLEFVSEKRNLMVYSRFLSFLPTKGDYLQMAPNGSDQDLIDRAKAQIDQLGFIGITEDYDADYRRFEKWLGLKPAGTHVPAINVNPVNTTPLPTGIVERIVNLAAVDIEIYKYAKKAAAERRSQE